MREFLIFCADPSGVYHNPIKHFKWTTTDYSKDNIVFYTDSLVTRPNKIGKVKIAWLFESEPLNQIAYNYIRENYNEFDYVFTWDANLLAIDKRFIFIPYGTSWLPSSEYAMYDKSKLVSIVASSKRQLPGHKLRHEIIDQWNNRLDLYGKGYNPIPSLLPAFKDYWFTVVVENTQEDCNFTEKLITPLLCGTVPIYFGCPRIGDFFDTRGMIIFNDITEIGDILNSLSFEKYEQMLPYIRDNFETAKSYQLVDDTVFNKLIELGLA